MEQSELLIRLCTHLTEIGVRYFITGSQATIAFGEPRFTNAMDSMSEDSNFLSLCLFPKNAPLSFLHQKISSCKS